MNPVKYASSSEDTGQGPSAGVWKDCDWDNFQNDPRKGHCIFDHFFALPATGLMYTLDESDDQSSVALLNTSSIGELQLIIAADDNEETVIASAVPWCEIDAGDSAYGRAWFEARIKTSSIATDMAIFCGLTSIIGAGDGIIQVDDTAAANVTNISYIGFRTLCADGDGLDLVYGTAAGAETILLESASGLDGQTLTADTYVKVGLYFDGAYIRYFINGVEAAKVAESTSGVPDGVKLGFAFSNKVGANQALTSTIDWVRFAQERND